MTAGQVPGECLRVREKYRLKAKGVYHFQQAKVLSGSRTVSDVIRHLKESLPSIYILGELLL